MADVGAVTRAVLRLAQGGSDERALARGICAACVEGLDVDGAAISVMTASDARETLWASDDVAERLEDLQFSLNEGACVQAATTGSPVLVPDLAHSTETARWPIFAAAVAKQTRARALFALPLQWGVTNLGVLDLYRCEAGGLSHGQWRDALSVADIAALLLLGLHTDPRTDGTHGERPEGDEAEGGAGDGWLELLRSRRVEVHQATGMVLVQLGVSATEALARMRGYAFARERLLTDVARDVVDRRLVFTDDME